MNLSQNDLLLLLDDGDLIGKLKIPSESSVEEILMRRDSRQFAKEWMSVCALVESHDTNLSEAARNLSTKIREISFLRAFARWRSSDLAAYISDDFGLISDTAALDIKNSQVDMLLTKYVSLEIPTQFSDEPGDTQSLATCLQP